MLLAVELITEENAMWCELLCDSQLFDIKWIKIDLVSVEIWRTRFFFSFVSNAARRLDWYFIVVCYNVTCFTALRHRRIMIRPHVLPNVVWKFFFAAYIIKYRERKSMLNKCSIKWYLHDRLHDVMDYATSCGRLVGWRTHAELFLFSLLRESIIHNWIHNL